MINTTKVWKGIRLAYYLMTILTFATFPSITIPGMMPNSIVFLCYFITGLCSLLFVLDAVRD